MAVSLSEELLPVFVPVAVYWIGSGVYSLMMGAMKNHRLFTDEEEKEKNLASRRQVVAVVLVNQLLQMAGAIVFAFLGNYMGAAGKKGPDDDAAAAPPPPSLLGVAGQVATALLFVDAWLYFWHRLTHESRFMYKRFHAMHHRLVVPYAYGTVYLHPVDSFFSDTVGGGLAYLVSGMSPRTAAFFFSMITIKGLDDHCGMWFPGGHPFHRFLTNNTAMHSVHHQLHGGRHNFSNYFLCIWDRLLGTYMPYAVDRKDGGGYRLRAPPAAPQDVDENDR